MRWGLITRILPARFFIHPDHHLFFLKPSTRKMSSANLESFTQNITLPLIKELLDPDFLNVLLPPPAAPVKPDVSMQDSPNTTPVLAASNPMMDALMGTAHQTLTANRAPAYRSTLNATLDAFQAMNAHAYGTDNIDNNLKKSWEEDPELTLRIIWNLRSIHDGKSEKEAFYRAYAWLYEYHPRTAIANLHLLVDPVCMRGKSEVGMAHGYWKDLLNILALASLGELNTSERRPHFLHNYRYKKTPVPRTRGASRQTKYVLKDANAQKESKEDKEKAAAESNAQHAAQAKAKAKEVREAEGIQTHELLLRNLAIPKYRALYVAIARLFSEQLIKDLHVLNQINALPAGSADRGPLVHQISLAAKWAPTPCCSHDRQTNISTAIGVLLHHEKNKMPIALPSAFNSAEDPGEAQIIRSFLQRWVLAPLRKVSSVAEPLMASNRWKEIKYSRVPSVCMKNHTKHFFAHDPDGFEKYLISVESGKKKISGATLLPHELVAQAVALRNSVRESKKGELNLPALKEMRRKLAETQMRVVEGQWKSLIERLRESGTIENSIAVCDVSGSMGSITAKYNKKHPPSPILPAVALSLVLAQLARPPFNSGFITFSSNPQFVQLESDKSLADTVMAMNGTDWGMNTDFNKVFTKLLLPLAKKNEVKPEDMIKRLFVFSDMQFDAAVETRSDPADWETNYDVVEKEYKEAGYEVPQIVFWDLAGYGTKEVTAERRGVALMNGFSPGMLKVFMGEAEAEEGAVAWEEVREDGETVTVQEDEFNPLNVMKKALTKASFAGLLVID